MKMWNIFVVALLAMTPTVIAQNPIDVLTGSVQDQINTAGQQLQQKAVQHAVEGNLTQEHLSQDLGAAKQNLTKEAREKLNQKLNENLNLTAEQAKQKAAEELNRQINQKVPGFDGLMALLGILAAALVIARRN